MNVTFFLNQGNDVPEATLYARRCYEPVLTRRTGLRLRRRRHFFYRHMKFEGWALLDGFDVTSQPGKRDASG